MGLLVNYKLFEYFLTKSIHTLHKDSVRECDCILTPRHIDDHYVNDPIDHGSGLLAERATLR